MDTSAVEKLANTSESRLAFWASFVQHEEARIVAEVGVYRGDFAKQLLRSCPAIQTYYLIDPWRHLVDWNKPANKSADEFDRYYNEVLKKMEPFGPKPVVLRGRTTEVIDKVADEELDFAYIDADHTLRGITIDLIRLFRKVREGGWIGGDDFDRSIWEHGGDFEPTMVFPFAVHFAEAVGAPIYALPRNQFLIQKQNVAAFEFLDLTGQYETTDLRSQTRQPLREQAFSLAHRMRRRLTRSSAP